MSSTADRLWNEILLLPAVERARLAGNLILSLDPPPESDAGAAAANAPGNPSRATLRTRMITPVRALSCRIALLLAATTRRGPCWGHPLYTPAGGASPRMSLCCVTFYESLRE